MQKDIQVFDGENKRNRSREVNHGKALLFVCEAWIDPRFALFVNEIVRSQVVPATVRPALGSEIVRRFRRSYRQPTCGFESFLASFAFQSICSQKSFRLRS